MKRPVVIFLNGILLWDLHELRHPTYTLRSTFVVEKTYPSGSTFRHELNSPTGESTERVAPTDP